MLAFFKRDVSQPTFNLLQSMQFVMANIKVISYEDATGKLKDIYDGLIKKRGKLADVNTIQRLNPDTIIAHMELYMSFMFSHSPLTRAQREMIAVVVSAANGCNYCQQHHRTALNKYWKDDARIELLKRNDETVRLDATDTRLCHYATELTIHPDDFENEKKTMDLRESGLDDRGILDATLVVGYFNFVNRVVLYVRPFSLSVSRVLHFNCVNLMTVTQAEQEGKLFGRLASVLWVCVPANVLALWRWLLKTPHISPFLWCYLWLSVSCKCA